jgi:FAD/FMN-containing dehydrogenase
MQSNSSFSVGGSLSVNCHGWQIGSPPISSTVESFRLMLADGSIARCSRAENRELFGLALGGYGLFGIILDAELRTYPDKLYHLDSHIFPVDKIETAFEEILSKPSRPELAFARMCIVPGERTFLREGVWNIFRPVDVCESITVKDPDQYHDAVRLLFRGSQGSDYGKELRWQTERLFAKKLSGSAFQRSSILNQGVETIENRSATTTDILHEYFVPKGKSVAFLHGLRRLIPKHKMDLLNVTVRQVGEDKDTVLRYADSSMFSFVLLFVQDRSEEGESDMQAVTTELIDLALSMDGRFYLPYRLHASREQFHRAYPAATRFLEGKRHYDPREVFQNQFYRRYGSLE